MLQAQTSRSDLRTPTRRRDFLSRPATHVADQLEQIVGDRELAGLKGPILPRGEPELTRHLNLSQPEAFSVSGERADQHGQHL